MIKYGKQSFTDNIKRLEMTYFRASFTTSWSV